MRRFSFLCALPTLGVLALTSISARAEVPQSRVIHPKEDRDSPRERALQEAEWHRDAEIAAMSPQQRLLARREARTWRTGGIVATSVGGAFVALGGSLLAARLSQTRDGASWTTSIGGGLLGMGCISLAMGIPMLVTGVSRSHIATMPRIQIGPTSAALTWSF